VVLAHDRGATFHGRNLKIEFTLAAGVMVAVRLSKCGTFVLKMSTIHAIESLSFALVPKSRGRILGLIYGSSDRAFYLREVVERTGLAIGQVQRELARLSDAGLVRRFRQGRHVYFQANDRCRKKRKDVFRELLEQSVDSRS
jgi:DNA-binding transcriptional regulator GbsR (MarR family)